MIQFSVLRPLPNGMALQASPVLRPLQFPMVWVGQPKGFQKVFKFFPMVFKRPLTSPRTILRNMLQRASKGLLKALKRQ